MNNEISKTNFKESKTLYNNLVNKEKNFNKNLISFFIIDHKGLIILARQFQSITKSELFYHAAFFHQYLTNLDKNQVEKSSFFDNKDNRYVYFPMENSIENENLYSILLINSKYNILSAISVIKLIQRMIFEIIKTNEREISNKNSTDKDKGLSKNIKQYCYEIILSIDDIVCQEGQLVNTTNNLENLKDNLKMESYVENAFNLVKQEKENQAKLNLVKGIEEINRLKRENKYFDNSISSDLYNKVTEVVDDLTDNLAEENDDTINQTVRFENDRSKKAGMILKKKLVENLIQIREDSIKMTNFYINCESIFEKLENEIKKKVIKMVNEESDNEDEDYDTEIGFSTGIKLTPIPIFFKTVESDEDY